MNGPQPAPPAGPWARYLPSERAPWDLRRAAHLHRRAGFAATWGELQRDLRDGPEASVGRLLAGKARSLGVPADFGRTADLLARAALDSGEAVRVKAAWLYRMLLGPDPLGERLTLFWHNHFATGNAKVNNLPAMWRQNELFRELARAPFGRLLDRAVRDPALLVCLDAPENVRGRPNENLAREVMELFTLGRGHYTEADVREAARALTGWTVAGDAFREEAEQHDDGDKTILGRRGRWRGGDLVRLLLDHPATAERLAGRLCREFLGEAPLDAAAVRALAAGLRQRDLDVGWAVETILRSEVFFAEATLGNRVLGPAEFVVGSARALELVDPPPSTLVLAEWTTRLGQDLFDPPNVGGWPGGRWWITAFALVGRDQFAAAVAAGELGGSAQPLPALDLARRHGRGGTGADVIDFYAGLLLGIRPDRAWRDRLLAVLGPGGDLHPEGARRALALTLASPEAQIC
jgi:uncharacterized protein (DUF1800 family)